MKKWLSIRSADTGRRILISKRRSFVERGASSLLEVALVLTTSVVCADAHAARKVKVSEEVAVLNTSLGEIAFRFFAQESPKSIEHFKKLANAGFYNGLLFHRVLPGLLIQAGDPSTREESTTPPGTRTEPPAAEANTLKHHRGTVSLFREQSGPMNPSEFFICLQEVTYFNGRHTIIGEVISGQKVVEAISQVPRNLKQAPLFPVRIRWLSVEVREYLREEK